MRTTLAMLLKSGFWPTRRIAEKESGHHAGPFPYAVRSRSPPYPRYHHHDDDWIVPLAFFGGFVGILALSHIQPACMPPALDHHPCRDTYNEYDLYGKYRYSGYVDRSCED